MIAGMAYSTLKSGAATQDSVTFGYQPEIHVNGLDGRGPQSGYSSNR
jgi:hypothetical protein